jgi:hypothetical protein
MIRHAVILEVWLSILILATGVGYGLSERWGRFEAVIIGIPLLVWMFFTWRKIREFSEAELEFGLTLRLIAVCLFSCILMLGLEREFTRILKQPWIAVIAVVWMTPSVLLFIRKMLAVRKDLYQK